MHSAVSLLGRTTSICSSSSISGISVGCSSSSGSGYGVSSISGSGSGVSSISIISSVGNS